MFPPWGSSALSPLALLPHALASPSYTAVAAGTHQLHLPPPVQPLTPAPAPNIWFLSFPTVPAVERNPQFWCSSQSRELLRKFSV